MVLVCSTECSQQWSGIMHLLHVENGYINLPWFFGLYLPMFMGLFACTLHSIPFFVSVYNVRRERKEKNTSNVLVRLHAE